MREFFLKTKRIGFSLWSEEDLPKALELWGSSEVTKFIVSDGIMTDEQIKERLNKEIQQHKDNGIQYWPIFLIETNEIIGCCGLRSYDLKNNIVEMGVHLKEEYWEKGLAKEAGLAIIEYAFENLKANGIFAGHNPNNINSAQLLKKLGFRYTHDEFYIPTGLYHPSYLMTKEEYKINKGEYNNYK